MQLSLRTSLQIILPTILILCLLLALPMDVFAGPTLPDIASGGDRDLIANSATTTQNGMYYAIWLIGIVLIMVPAYFLIGAFGDWMKGRKELGEVGVVIIVGVVVVLAGMWLLSTAQTMTTAGIGVGA